MLASPNDVLFRPAHIQLAAILEVELQRCCCADGAVLRKAECMYRSLSVCCSLRGGAIALSQRCAAIARPPTGVRAR
jgi:hypothetical protein